MPASERAVELALAAAQAAADKLASDILLLDVSEQLVITDVFLLASAPNDRQVKAVVDEIEDRLRELGAKPVRREGAEEGRWVLLDFGDIVVHVQHEEERVFYALERLWKDCPVIPFVDADVERAAGRAVASAPERSRGASSCCATAARRTTRAAASRASSTSPLDELGRAQAAGRRPQALAAAAAVRGAVSSDLRPRPRHRAAAGDARPGCRSCVDARLRELDLGAWQGLTVAEAARALPRGVRRLARRRGRRRAAAARPTATPAERAAACLREHLADLPDGRHAASPSPTAARPGRALGVLLRAARRQLVAPGAARQHLLVGARRGRLGAGGWSGTTPGWGRWSGWPGPDLEAVGGRSPTPGRGLVECRRTTAGLWRSW